MPFTGNQYNPPNGAENAAPGTVVQSAIWNAIFTDMAAAFTTLMTQANTTPTWSNILAPNGGFAVWQRGAGSTASFAVNASTTQYTADRWYITTGANQASVVAAATGLTNAAPTAHAAKITRNSGQTGTTAMTFGYPLTLDEVNRLRGQQISFSGAAKAGANWSPASGTFAINVYVGTGSAGKRGGGFTNETNPLSISVNLAAGATNLAITGTSTGTVATTSTQGEIQVTWTPVGTAGGDDSLTLDQFCLVVGTLVQSFSDLPFDEALRECKRFYRKSFPYAVAPTTSTGLSGAVSTISQASSQIGFYVQLEPVELNASPGSISTFSPTGSSSNWANAAGVSVTVTIDITSPSAKGFGLFSVSAVTAANEIFYIHYAVDSGL